MNVSLKTILINSFLLFHIFIINSEILANSNLILDMQVTKHKISCTINPSLSKKYLRQDTFFIEYDDVQIDNLDYEILTMPLILNIFSTVWLSGESFYVDSMDENLFISLQKQKEILQYLYPNIKWNGEIIPHKIKSCSKKYKPSDKKDNKKGILFSLGLDSTSSFFSHHSNGEKLHFITILGHPDLPVSSDESAPIIAAIKEFAKRYGATFSFARSNYWQMYGAKTLCTLHPEIHDWRICTMEGASWLGLAMPILIKEGCSTLIMGASHNWYEKRRISDMPFVTSLLDTAGYNLEVDQFDMTRAQKLSNVAQIVNKNGYPIPGLKVCADIRKTFPNNCGKCIKCRCLMMDLLVKDYNLQEWGFNISKEQAAKNLLELNKKGKATYLSAWSMKEIQEHAKKAIVINPEKKHFLNNILKIDVDSLNISDKNNLEIVDWQDLKEWCNKRNYAKNVIVPENLSQELISIQLKQAPRKKLY